MMKIGERLGQLIALVRPEGRTERFSRKEIGYQAATILFRPIEQDEDYEPYTTEVPVELVVRASTGPLPPAR